MSLRETLIAIGRRRHPDIEIGPPEHPYLRRWWLIRRNRFFNVYLHQFLGDDDDRALHDHPWVNCSIVLRGVYVEILFDTAPIHGEPLPPLCEEVRRAHQRPVFRRATTAHRVTLLRDKEGRPIPCWSLFLTGPMRRSWGFWCPMGRWVHWKSFTAGPNGKVVGAGCGDPVEFTQRGGG